MSTEREPAEPGRGEPEASDAEAGRDSEVGDGAGVVTDEEGAIDVDLAQLRTERDELVDTARRLQADFENFKKRMLREQTDVVSRATERLVEELLPVLDSFELALLNLPDDEGDAGRVRKGVELVFAELLGVLEKHGLERVVADGQPFDPTEHEAVLHEDGEADHPMVAETMRTGYRLRGRVLRPAMVKVVR